MSIDSYLSAYLDRRMKYIIEEWQLGTRSDLKDLVSRFETAQKEVSKLKDFEHNTHDRLTDMEARVRTLKEKRQ